MTVESNYVIVIATLSDSLKSLAPVYQSITSKTKTIRTLYAWFFQRFEKVICNWQVIIARNSDWFITLFAPVVIGRSNNFCFGLKTALFLQENYTWK